LLKRSLAYKIDWGNKNIRNTSINEIKELLNSLEVEKGDIVMVHSSIFTLGIIEKGLSGLYQAFREALGENGTLIVPTFTYSFRRNKIFDVRNTPTGAEIGAFSEYVRKLPESIRSTDPLFSMAAIGPKAEYLMKRKSHRCFGQDSIYNKIFDANALFVALGITYSTGITAFLHLECIAGIDYRKETKFDGQSIGYDGEIYDDWAIHFARNEEQYPLAYTNRDPLGNKMEKLGISKAVDFGSGHHIALRAKPFKEFVLTELKKNPHLMLVNKKNKKNQTDI